MRESYGLFGCILAVVLVGIGIYPARSTAEEPDRKESPSPADENLKTEFSGRLGEYVDFALRHHPELIEQHARWQQKRRQAKAVGTWPEPMFSYSLLVVPIETRVGPQRHRFSVNQTIPWPGARSAARSAREYQAAETEAVFDARMTTVRRRVAELYWERWRARRVLHWQNEQLELLRTIESTIRARVETGGAPASQLHQIGVEQTQVRDAIDGTRASLETLNARFQRALGLSGEVRETPISPRKPPAPRRPVQSDSELVEMARNHPDVVAAQRSLRAAQKKVQQTKLENAPHFQVGAMYMETGEARMEGVDDSGKDPVSVTVAISLPIWLGANRSRVGAAEAETEARRARVRAMRQSAAAETRTALARIRESARRIRRFKETLVPQAETAVDSVLGRYESGDADFASVLVAQQRLLTIRLRLAEVRARHAQQWARLESLVGQPLEQTEIDNE